MKLNHEIKITVIKAKFVLLKNIVSKWFKQLICCHSHRRLICWCYAQHDPLVVWVSYECVYCGKIAIRKMHNKEAWHFTKDYSEYYASKENFKKMNKLLGGKK